jgi:hypothetical protein
VNSRAATFPALSEPFPAVSWIFRDYYIIFYLCDVIFVLCEICVICSYIWMYEKKKKGYVCVCIFFLCMLLNYKIKRIEKMNLMF